MPERLINEIVGNGSGYLTPPRDTLWNLNLNGESKWKMKGTVNALFDEDGYELVSIEESFEWRNSTGNEMSLDIPDEFGQKYGTKPGLYLDITLIEASTDSEEWIDIFPERESEVFDIQPNKNVSKTNHEGEYNSIYDVNMEFESGFNITIQRKNGNYCLTLYHGENGFEVKNIGQEIPPDLEDIIDMICENYPELQINQG